MNIRLLADLLALWIELLDERAWLDRWIEAGRKLVPR